MNLFLRTAYGDVETVFAPLVIEPAEVAMQSTVRVFDVPDGEDNNVALVPLDVLDVLNE